MKDTLKPLLALFPVALALLDCRGQVRFDEHPFDGSTDQAAECNDPGCGFETERCGADACELECHSRRVCSGACGARCSVECEPNSDCTVVSGAGSHVRCQKDARCTVALGPAGTAACGEGARCTVRCSDDCSVQCDGQATCSLACGSEPSPRAFAGTGTCP